MLDANISANKYGIAVIAECILMRLRGQILLTNAWHCSFDCLPDEPHQPLAPAGQSYLLGALQLGDVLGQAAGLPLGRVGLLHHVESITVGKMLMVELGYFLANSKKAQGL